MRPVGQEGRQVGLLEPAFDEAEPRVTAQRRPGSAP